MAIKKIKLKNAVGDYLYPYTDNIPTATVTEAGKVQLDSTPTAGSLNALTSGGAKLALDAKVDKTAIVDKATADADGNDIVATYATKEALSSIEAKANEAKSIAEGRVRASAFADYAELVSTLNTASKDSYKIGDIFYIQAQNVPDLWVYQVEDDSATVEYTHDEAIVSAIETDGFIKIGYFKIAAMESNKIDLLGFVPSTRTINGKALNGDISLNASDVGALSASATATRATADADGNEISSTYAKLADSIAYEIME